MECRNPGCGQQVLLTELEYHLKEECPQRRVNCKDCGKEMYYIELQQVGNKLLMLYSNLILVEP